MVAIGANVTAGSWPDWIAAVGTSLAFLVAAFSFRRSVRVRREAQARLVYAKNTVHKDLAPGTPFTPPDTWGNGGTVPMYIVQQWMSSDDQTFIPTEPMSFVSTLIHNGSDEIVGPGKVQIFDYGLNRVAPGAEGLIGLLEPRTEQRIDLLFPNPHYPNSPGLIPTIIFRDSSGRWWRRFHTDPIESVHADPANTHITGTGEDPRVPVMARLRRLGRAARGKSPVP